MSGAPLAASADCRSAEALAATHALAFPAPQVWASHEFDALFATRGIHLTGDSGCFILGRVLFGEAEILTLATHPDYRRQGRARACLAAFEAEVRAQGAETVFLEVSVLNLAAAALYAAAGYVQIGRRSAYYLEADGTRSDALVLSKTLGG